MLRSHHKHLHSDVVDVSLIAVSLQFLWTNIIFFTLMSQPKSQSLHLKKNVTSKVEYRNHVFVDYFCNIKMTNKCSNFCNDQIATPQLKAVYAFNDKKEREKNIEESTGALQILENELKDKFFGGEEIGFVDIAAVFIAFWTPLFQDLIGVKWFSAEKHPKLYKWSQEFLNHPIVKENVPPRDPLLANFKARYDRAVSASK